MKKEDETRREGEGEGEKQSWMELDFVDAVADSVDV